MAPHGHGPEDGTASTGIDGLDRALGRLLRGDNVVWELEKRASLDPFVEAILRVRDQFDLTLAVTVAGDPAPLRAAHPGVETLDARRGSGVETPEALVRRVRERVRRTRRALVLVESLDALSARWGDDDHARRLFTRLCPLLLDLNAVAYWSLTPGRHVAALRRAIDAVTQCVLVLGGDRLRIAKAEGRPPGVQGSVLHLRDDHGRPALEPAPTAARLGAALRAVRIQRHLSQGEIAALAGVSASAISQAERGRRGLSLDTLLDLTARLDITIDELLRGEIALGYRLSRAGAGPRNGSARLSPLLDDPEVGLRARLSRLAPHESVRVPAGHGGVELVAVAAGLVQVILPTGRPVLRRGETLLAERSGVTGWRNVGDEDAMVFWILRDEAGPRP
ncbi:MAG: helix-turn-helix domain-containing protein [Solirubrobacteraceae bacterium]|nr:helix-turn-helix domain-containing protein [Solirubrobacteraceae bacterium]